MGKRLEGRRALVTAAAMGIGEAIARRYAAEGASVIATDINTDALSALNEVEGIETAHLDVTNGVQVREVIGGAGPLDILTNCAGFVHDGDILKCQESEWDFAFELNVKSMYRTISAALPAMVENGGGAIVNIASVASSIKGVPVRFAYGSSKAAVIGLTKSVAADYVTKGIRCNAICPGTVQSPSLNDRIAAQGDPEEARKAFIARQPMGRLGTTEEIAALAAHLVSDDGSYQTGTAVIVDGGMTL